jgi:glutamate 5-kinase
VIGEITPEIEAMAGEAGEDARGGMITKLMAAKTAVHGGCAMAIVKGTAERPLSALQDGARCTWFLPSQSPAAARKQWIAGMKPLGQVHVDAGAAKALRGGRSLLPAGVTAVDGQFERGDPVAIIGPGGVALGAALCGYSAGEAAAIAGRRTSDIAAILGYPGRAAMAHRDDLILWQ